MQNGNFPLSRSHSFETCNLNSMQDGVSHNIQFNFENIVFVRYSKGSKTSIVRVLRYQYRSGLPHKLYKFPLNKFQLLG